MSRAGAADEGGTHRVLVTAFGAGSPKIRSTTWLRAQAFAGRLATRGVELHVSGTVPPSVFPEGWDDDRTPAKLKRLGAIALGTVKRLWQWAILPYRYDVHVALRDVLLYTGPPVFERLFARRAPFFVFELDDSLWEPPPDGGVPPMWTADRAITAARLADRIIAGNEYLAEWARQFCDDVRIIPTVPDDEIRPRAGSREPGPCRIGWYGQLGGFHLAEPVLPALADAAAKTPVELHLISHPDIASSFTFPESLPPRVIPWDPDTQGRDLTSFDVGIMPMPDTAWTRGKCANKLIHYMAAGLPVVASPHGMNREVVVHGETGFLADTHEEWVEALTRLAEDPDLRDRMGRSGRERYETHYSQDAAVPLYAEAVTPPHGVGRRRLSDAFGRRTTGRP